MKKYFVEERSGRDYPGVIIKETELVSFIAQMITDEQLEEVKEFMETSQIGDEWDDNWVLNIKLVEDN